MAQSMDENQLIIENAALVNSIANKFKPKNSTERDEFVQQGMVGLLKAIRFHDPEKAKLSTISYILIVREIISYIEKQERLNREIDGTRRQDPHYNIDELLPDNLTEKEVTILKERMLGYNFTQISKKLGQCTLTTRKQYKNALNKIKEANKDD